MTQGRLPAEELREAGDLYRLRQSLPSDESVIYFLFQDGEIVYVGQSKRYSGLPRILNHLTQMRIRFDSYATLVCALQQLSDLEAAYIAKFNPRENLMFPTGTGYYYLAGVAEKLRISLRVVRRFASERKIPSYLNGYYRLDDFDPLIQEITSSPF